MGTERTSPGSTVTAEAELIAIFDPDYCTGEQDSNRFRRIVIELDASVVLSETLDFVMSRRIPDCYERELSRSLEPGRHTIRVQDRDYGLEATLDFECATTPMWIQVGYSGGRNGRASGLFLGARESPLPQR